MVTILIVSHSAEIARGVKQMADQMVQGRAAIAAAGGMPDGSLGTSADVISAALEQVRSPEGVLVLVDLGSAVMSAEMVLEASGEHFLISRAPLVEGALVAAVQASTGVSLEQVALAAERALEAKVAAIAPVPDVTPLQPAPATAQQAPAAQLPELVLTIQHKDGLHLRPATPFVRTAASFKSTIRVRNLDRPDSPEANAKSMLDIMKLAIRQGQRIRITAEGDDANEALEALKALVEGNFGDS